MKKRMLSFVLVLGMIVTLLGATTGSMAESGFFTDVSAEAWYAEYVDICYQAGLMNGVGNGRFRPEGTVSIAQAIALCARLHRLLTQAEEPVAQGGEHWAKNDADHLIRLYDEASQEEIASYQEMATAIEETYPQLNALVNATAIPYDEDCPRAVAAALLYLVLPTESLMSINDYTALPELDTEGLRTLYNAGILSGIDAAGTFDGAATLTRAQMSAIVARVITTELRLKNMSAIDDFDFALFAAMPQDKNFMISPLSLKLALAMVANGAADNTKQELLDALDITDLAAYNDVVKTMIESLNSKDSVEFNVANSIWFNTDYYGTDNARFSDDFAAVIKNAYYGVANQMTNATGKKAVNGWISQATRDKINNVIEDESVKESLAMLVNAIYFKGDWANPFQSESTKPKTFTDKNGGNHTLSFMNQTGGLPYYRGNGFRMVAKSYADKDINMYIILADEGVALTHADFDAAIAGMKNQRVHLSMPKFKTEYTNNRLAGIMQSMGVRDAFDENAAKFEGMFQDLPGEESIVISKITQKTFIEVDEKGTEAAAATVIEFATTTSIMPVEDPIQFICDRPFVYIIRDDSTGTILFMGEYGFAE